jgi:hypothetical protein
MRIQRLRLILVWGLIFTSCLPADVFGFALSASQSANGHIIITIEGEAPCPPPFAVGPTVEIAGSMVTITTGFYWLICSPLPPPFTIPVDVGILPDGDYTIKWDMYVVSPSPPTNLVPIFTSISIVNAQLVISAIATTSMHALVFLLIALLVCGLMALSRRSVRARERNGRV